MTGVRWVTRLTVHGIPYDCMGDGDVPGIPQEWLDAIIYLYPTEMAAQLSEPFGGTGFLMSVDPTPGLPPQAGVLYAVTNAHVIEGGCPVIRINTHDGGFDVMPIQPDGWFLHPDGDDIALAPIGPGPWLKYTHVPFDMALPKAIVDAGDLGVGDEAFFIGRFVYRDGTALNTPTARFGSIARVGGDPIPQQGRGRSQESILVEVHSLSGFSGSPVFAYRGATFAPHADDPNRASIIPEFGSRVYLLGVDWGSDPWTAEVRDASTSRPVASREYVQAPSGMSMVVPAWKLQGALDHPKLIEFRQIKEQLMKDKEADKDQGAAIMDMAGLPSDGTP